MKNDTNRQRKLKQESQKHITPSLRSSPLGARCQPANSLWHRQSESHPSAAKAKPSYRPVRDFKKITSSVWAESDRGENSPETHDLRAAGETDTRAKRAPLSAKWKDVQSGRLYCLHKAPWIICTFRCSYGSQASVNIYPGSKCHNNRKCFCLRKAPK